MDDRRSGMQRLPTLEDQVAGRGPRRRDLRPSRVRVGVALGVAAYPAALLAESATGVDPHLVFAVLWLSAAISQAFAPRTPWDRLALLGLVLYVVSFAMPAGVPPLAGSGSSAAPLGYQVFGMPPVAPLKHLPAGGLMAGMVGLSIWLANPLFVLAAALYRLREGTLAALLSGAAFVFGLMAIPAVDLAIGHIFWLAAPLALGGAATWARESW